MPVPLYIPSRMSHSARATGPTPNTSEYFLGYTTAHSEGQGTATPSLSLPGGGGGAAGGGRGGGGSTAAGADAPAAPAAPVPQLTGIENIRAAQNAKIAQPDTASSAVRETRQDTPLCEYEEYRKKAALPDTDSTFTALEYWRPRAVDGLDKSGNIVVPADWPHVGLVARLHLGIDATSCQAERNFSALKLVVSDLHSHTSPAKVEKTIFLRLNTHLVPGLGKVLRDLDALTAERKSNKEAAVDAKNATAGPTDVYPA